MATVSVESDIDRLLSGLRNATSALKFTLDTAANSPATTVRTPAPVSSKENIIRLLMQEVERRYGIAPNDQVERKLVRIFEPMTLDALESWSQALLSHNAIEAEWLSLVECLTVHETYFDRDKDQLGIIFSDILPSIIKQKHQSGDYRIRIWSSACSSGEEAYNLTMLSLMALKDAGFALERQDGSIVPIQTWDLSILGSDVSSQMIRTAKDATYSTLTMGSFRDMSPRLWKFFEELPEQADPLNKSRTMKIKRCVSDVTRFRRHNLLDVLQEPAPFDLILCRNVLIYFDDTTKMLVQKRLIDKLKSGGVLVLGATDVLKVPDFFERRMEKGCSWYIKK